MKQVAAGLFVAAPVLIANCWLLRDAGRAFLIDTGHGIERRALARALGRAGVSGQGDLTAVLLTHRHSDHAGNAAWARERFGCPIVCHAADAKCLGGGSRIPRLGGRRARHVEELLCRVEDWFPARCQVDDVFQVGSWRWGFDVVEVGGHTEGSVLLHHRPSGALFTGDALLTGIPAQRIHTRLRLAIPAFSEDAPKAHTAVLDFLASRPSVQSICAGHGPPVTQHVARRLRRLQASR